MRKSSILSVLLLDKLRFLFKKPSNAMDLYCFKGVFLYEGLNFVWIFKKNTKKKNYFFRKSHCLPFLSIPFHLSHFLPFLSSPQISLWLDSPLKVLFLSSRSLFSFFLFIVSDPPINKLDQRSFLGRKKPQQIQSMWSIWLRSYECDVCWKSYQRFALKSIMKKFVGIFIYAWFSANKRISRWLRMALYS